MKLNKKYTDEISRSYTLRKGEKKLSKHDKDLLNRLRDRKPWGTIDRYYYSILEKKMLMNYKDLWKLTKGDMDKIIKIILPYFSDEELHRIYSVTH